MHVCLPTCAPHDLGSLHSVKAGPRGTVSLFLIPSVDAGSPASALRSALASVVVNRREFLFITATSLTFDAVRNCLWLQGSASPVELLQCV